MEQIIAGVDIGGTTLKIALITPDGELVARSQQATPLVAGEDGIVEQMAETIHFLLQQNGYTPKQACGIGVGVPGPVDTKTGVVRKAVNLHWKRPVPLQAKLEALSGLPVFVDNDANTAALGEMWRGAGRGAKDLVVLTLGTGIGGGVIVDGKIVHGINGAGGEIGHITMTPDQGSACNCGKTGCLETYSSATALIREGQLAATSGASPVLSHILKTNGNIQAKDVFDAAKTGDPAASAIVEEAVTYLGLALSHLGMLLNPSHIVIGGGVALAGDFLFSRLRKAFDRFVSFPFIRRSTQIVPATLGNDAGVYGAAWLIRSRMSP